LLIASRLLLISAIVPVLLPISSIIIVAPVIVLLAFAAALILVVELSVGTRQTTFPIHVVFVGFTLARIRPKLAQVVHVGAHWLTPRTGVNGRSGRICATFALIQMRIWVIAGEHLIWACRRIEIIQKTIAVGEIVDGQTIERCLEAF